MRTPPSWAGPSSPPTSPAGTARAKTVRVDVRTDREGHVVITADQLTDPGWEDDPAVRQALPAYLCNALT